MQNTSRNSAQHEFDWPGWDLHNQFIVIQAEEGLPGRQGDIEGGEYYQEVSKWFVLVFTN